MEKNFPLHCLSEAVGFTASVIPTVTLNPKPSIIMVSALVIGQVLRSTTGPYVHLVLWDPTKKLKQDLLKRADKALLKRADKARWWS